MTMKAGLTALSVMGAVISLDLSPAQAQTNNTLYNTTTGYNNYSSAYGTSPTGIPLYNGNAQPLPMQQMIAGRNAPSYNYGGSNAYTGAGTTSGILSAADAEAIRQQRDMLAQQYQQQYMASLQQGNPNGQYYQQGQQQQPYGQMTQINPLTGQPYAYGQQPQKRVVQRVIYKERNNLSPTPQRLFNPDQ